MGCEPSAILAAPLIRTPLLAWSRDRGKRWITWFEIGCVCWLKTATQPKDRTPRPDIHNQIHQDGGTNKNSVRPELYNPRTRLLANDACSRDLLTKPKSELTYAYPPLPRAASLFAHAIRRRKNERANKKRIPRCAVNTRSNRLKSTSSMSARYPSSRRRSGVTPRSSSLSATTASSWLASRHSTGIATWCSRT